MFYNCRNLININGFNVNNFFGYNLRNQPPSGLTSVFYGCLKLPDYANINSGWK
jgi:hypothetical protein